MYSMAVISSTFFDSTVFLGYVSRSSAVECCAAAAETHSWESTDTRQPMRKLLSDRRMNGFSPLNILYMKYSDANYVPDNFISIEAVAEITWTSCWEIRAPDADLTPQGRPWEPRPPTSTRPDLIFTTSNSSSKDQDQGYEQRKRINWIGRKAIYSWHQNCFEIFLKRKNYGRLRTQPQ